ncbi:antitoxin [Janibacter sp. DB-40]|uniref:antitoxin n=1 Tax=Janibacter sp. DB-40 TaxID=3028808 RepID=UPI002406108A|nr:antitoxin [Janibacter sp. DB-40]
MGFFDKLLGRSGQLKDKAGTYASEHGDSIAQSLDKAGQAANRATKGRFGGQIERATGAAKTGVHKLGEQGGPAGGGPAGGGSAPPPPPPPGGPPPGGPGRG